MVRKSPEFRFRFRRCSFLFPPEPEIVDWPRARNEINANPLKLIPRAEWLNGGWIILVRAIGHTSRAARRAISTGLITPGALLFLPVVGLFSAFYDLAGGLLSTFSKARRRTLWQIMHDFSDLPPAGVFHEVVFFQNFARADKCQSTPLIFFL